jgi:hypothetical protein
VVHHEIVVTFPDSKYSPQLLAKRMPMEDDPRVPMTLSEFLGRAWWAANDKARELEWIV